VRINVGASGRVEGCTVIASAGYAALDSATCSLITRRYRFRPATRDGQPVASVATQRVTWRIPEGPEIRFGQGRFTWTVVVSSSGSTECRIEQIGQAFDRFDEGQCEEPEGARMIEPADLAPGQLPVRLTHVLSLIPEGEPSRLPRLTGSPTAEWTVLVEADAQGRVTSCTPVARQGEIPSFAYPNLGRGCESLLNRGIFLPAPGVPVRRARLGSTLYVEPQADPSS
jgi:TonB family protein